MLPASFARDAVVTFGSLSMQSRLVSVDSPSKSFDHEIDCLGGRRGLGMGSDRSVFEAQGRLGAGMFLQRMIQVVGDPQLDMDNRFSSVRPDSTKAFPGPFDHFRIDVTLGRDLERCAVIDGHVCLSFFDQGASRCDPLGVERCAASVQGIRSPTTGTKGPGQYLAKRGDSYPHV